MDFATALNSQLCGGILNIRFVRQSRDTHRGVDLACIGLILSFFARTGVGIRTGVKRLYLLPMISGEVNSLSRCCLRNGCNETIVAATVKLCQNRLDGATIQTDLSNCLELNS